MDYTRINSLKVCCLLLLTCAHEWPCAVFCCEKESCDSHEILKKDCRQCPVGDVVERRIYYVTRLLYMLCFLELQ
jgi:hypothetical protein